MPAEVSSLTQLERVDISHNSFVSLPECLFHAPKIAEIDARKNFIAGKMSARNSEIQISIRLGR